MANLSDFVGGGTDLSRIRLNDLGQTSSNVVLDLSADNAFELEPTADITIDLTNLASSGRAVAYVSIVGGGDHTLTWMADGSTSAIRWRANAQPLLATGSERDLLIFIQHSTGLLVGYEEAKDVP